MVATSYRGSLIPTPQRPVYFVRCSDYEIDLYLHRSNNSRQHGSPVLDVLYCYHVAERKSMSIAIYPGCFDPITLGHMDVIARAAKLFDKLVVAIGHNSDKQTLFTDDERFDMALADVRCRHNNVRVTCFSGLLGNFATYTHATAIVRCIRTMSDFDYELQMAATNRLLCGIETVFITPSQEYGFVNSSLVKDIARYGGDVSRLVSPRICKLLQEKQKGKE